MRPNIILFNPDQWRGDVMGHLGHPAAVTPNLDKLVATDGVSFSQAFCQNPVCVPSRCSFMTGWYPHVRGHRTQFHMLRPEEPMLLKRLKDQGYYVWWGGKNDVVPAQNGFEAYCDFKNPVDKEKLKAAQSPADWRGSAEGDNFYSFFLGKTEAPKDGSPYVDKDWVHVNAAVDFINNWDGDQPFCMYLPLVFPHPVYAVEEPWFSMIDRSKVEDPVPVPENWEGKPKVLSMLQERMQLLSWTPDRFKELAATYYGMIARVDHQFGLLMEALKEAGAYEDTAVFMFSDHGDFTGDYGLVEKTQNTFEDCLVNVPFVVKPPKNVNVEPGVRPQLVELVDMPATVEDFAGLPATHSHFGASLRALLGDAKAKGRSEVFSEGGRLKEETQASEIQGTAYKDKNNIYWPRISIQIEDHVAHTKAMMLRTDTVKYVARLDEDDELYLLDEDPKELHNRIHDPSCREVLLDMKERLMRFLVRTTDNVPFDADDRE